MEEDCYYYLYTVHVIPNAKLSRVRLLYSSLHAAKAQISELFFLYESAAQIFSDSD